MATTAAINELVPIQKVAKDTSAALTVMAGKFSGSQDYKDLDEQLVARAEQTYVDLLRKHRAAAAHVNTYSASWTKRKVRSTFQPKVAANRKELEKTVEDTESLIELLRHQIESAKLLVEEKRLVAAARRRAQDQRVQGVAQQRIRG